MSLRDSVGLLFLNMPLTFLRRSGALWLTVASVACASSQAGGEGGSSARGASWPQQLARDFFRVPDTIPDRWKGLIGEYGPDTTVRWIALERDGRMYMLDQLGNYVPLSETSESEFLAPTATAAVSGPVRFHRDTTGRAHSVQVADMVMSRRMIEPPPGATQLRITPVRPIEELRREALAARPPAEAGSFKPIDLVDVTALDSTIRLDIRYATTDNFLGTALYELPRALLQRPAATALARANRALRPLGFALLVHDAYRPWYVTRIFWDAVPADKKWLVADPAQGSKHNRGAAVDVTLYDLEHRRVAQMPSTYDESSTRAAADYPGGTSLQRYHRALLRRVLEHEGFVANPKEWWHFDYKDWQSYPILNVPLTSMAR